MATRFCLNCGGEFIASVEVCPDCELPLVDERPADHLDPAAGDATGQVSYELHDWAVESRVMLEQLLQAGAIVHAWEGTDLVIPAVFEPRVDALIDQVEVTTLPTLDPGAPKVAYEVAGWTDEQQIELERSLEEVGIPFEFDVDGDLIVLEEHEERVDAILDTIDFGDEDDAADEEDGELDRDEVASYDDDDEDDDEDDDDEDEDDDDDEEYDGPEAMDVLSDLFVAADRLQRKATDPEGVLSLVERAVDAERLPLPYGFDRPVWRDLVGQVRTLRDLLEDDDSEDEAIESHARVLRDTLRNYV